MADALRVKRPYKHASSPYIQCPRAEQVIPIGQFSDLSQLPVKTIRYYDEIGLFKPEVVDPRTGYRYYSFHQLPQVNRIKALRDLGFSLHDVKKLVNGKISNGGLEGIYRIRKTDILKDIQSKQMQLEEVELHLRQIELDGTLGRYAIVIKKIQPQTVLVNEGTIRHPADRFSLLSRIEALMNNQNLEPSGSPLAIMQSMENPLQTRTTMAVPIEKTTNVKSALQVKDLPGIDHAACVVHCGRLDDIHFAYTALQRWIENHHTRIVGSVRELYLLPFNTRDGMKEIVIEIQIPIKNLKDSA